MLKKITFLFLLSIAFNINAEQISTEKKVATPVAKEAKAPLKETIKLSESQRQLEAFLSQAQSISARFKQKLVDQYGYTLQESAGTLRMQRPGKFHWDYVLPYPQSIISNGKKIWMYDSELEQVNVRAYDQVLASSPVNLLDKNQNLNVEFNVQTMPFADQQYWLKLLPKNSESDFKEMLVGLLDGKIKTMRFIDNFNQTTQIEFEQLVVNPQFAKSQFEFVAPQGTDVLGDF